MFFLLVSCASLRVLYNGISNALKRKCHVTVTGAKFSSKILKNAGKAQKRRSADFCEKKFSDLNNSLNLGVFTKIFATFCCCKLYQHIYGYKMSDYDVVEEE